jgi:hypothetical protein
MYAVNIATYANSDARLEHLATDEPCNALLFEPVLGK